MITRIQVRNYKSLRYVDVPLRGLNVLVGPNASGKSAFLDVISFLHDFISEDWEFAVKQRTNYFFDLVWKRGENAKGFEIAIEADIPHRYVNEHDHKTSLRYEISFIYDDDSNEYLLSEEKCFNHISIPPPIHSISEEKSLITNDTLFEKPFLIKEIIPNGNNKNDIKKHYNDDHWYSLQQGLEIYDFQIPRKRKRSGFSELSDDQYEPNFLWFKKLLKYEIQIFYLDHFVMRKECMPGSGSFLKPDGSNLPWVIDDFKKKTPERFKEWLDHIRISLPYLEDIRAFPRPEDGYCFLMFKYANRPELPSWAVSDGTLRLLALTLPAYLPDAQGIYLFEEPENGIHPQAIETVMDSLKSFYDGQVLITTHSPLILSLVKPEEVLCFWNDSERGTQIIPGDRHPYLKDWKGEVSLGELFASGVFEWQPAQ